MTGYADLPAGDYCIAIDDRGHYWAMMHADGAVYESAGMGWEPRDQHPREIFNARAYYITRATSSARRIAEAVTP